jgi:hypothetical protein
MLHPFGEDVIAMENTADILYSQDTSDEGSLQSNKEHSLHRLNTWLIWQQRAWGQEPTRVLQTLIMDSSSVC